MLFKPNATQKKNLAKLAAYLSALPADYDHFDIGVYYSAQRERYYDDDGEFEEWYYDEDVTTQEVADGTFKEPANDCGTAACAIGHGNAAGIPILAGDLNWNTYSFRAFGTCALELGAGRYMFGAQNDNCHFAAARRIRQVLADPKKEYA